MLNTENIEWTNTAILFTCKPRPNETTRVDFIWTMEQDDRAVLFYDEECVRITPLPEWWGNSDKYTCIDLTVCAV